MTRTQTIATGLLILALMVGVLWWSNHRDKALSEWAEKYEACVAEEYRTTPWQWYAEHGEYPECDTTKVETPEPIIEINL